MPPQSAPKGAPSASRGNKPPALARWIRLSAAVVIAVAVLFSVAAVHQAYRADLDAAKRDAATVLELLHRHLETTLGGLEQVLARLGERFEDRAVSPEDLSSDLEAVAAPLLFVRAILLINDQGIVVSDSRPDRPAIGIDVSDRPYFIAHTRPDAPASFVSPPVISRVDQMWSFPISRAVRSPAGDLRGVLVTSFSNTYLSDYFAAVARDVPGLTIILTDRDGTIFARWPKGPMRVGTSIENSRLIRERVPGGDPVPFWATSPYDAVTRLGQFRLLDSVPMVLAVGMDRDAVFRRAIQQAAIWSGVLLVFVVVVGVASHVLVRMARSVETARAEAELADRRKDEFVANMSHEIRTPLNAIVGFSEMLSEDALGKGLAPTYREYARDIQDSGLYLLDIVNDLLDLSVIMAGRLELSEDTVTLDNVVGTVINQVAKRAADEGVSLSVTPLPDPGPRLRVDRRRLCQVLLNLLTNAIKYTGFNGRVTLSVVLAQPSVSFVVEDNGPGIAPERLATILEPFERGAPADVATSEGVGLGLAISARLMRAHGGDLVVESEPGQGTRVTVTLPPERVLAFSG
jgi:signal transduction histidine kinase